MYTAPEVFLAPYIYTTFLSTLPPLILLAIGLTFVIGAGEIDLSLPGDHRLFRLRLRRPLQGLQPRLDRGRRGAGLRRPRRLRQRLLIARIGIPSFMATLGTQFFWSGMATVLSGGKSYALRGAEDRARSGSGSSAGRSATPSTTPGMDAALDPGAVDALIVVFLWFILNRHRFGEHVLFIGDSNDVSRVVGIDVDREKIKLFTLMGLLGVGRRDHPDAGEQELFRQPGAGLSADRHRLRADRRHLDLRRPGDDHRHGLRLLHHRHGRGGAGRDRPHRRLGAHRAGPHLPDLHHLLPLRRRTAAARRVLRALRRGQDFGGRDPAGKVPGATGAEAGRDPKS